MGINMAYKVPFLDLKSINLEYENEFKSIIEDVLESGWFVNGGQLSKFEKEYAAFSGAKYCIGVGNGLEALRLLLLANNIGQGDEVLVPSNTFIATWLAVTQVGATPIPVEPDKFTYNIDPSLLSASLTNKTKAIIPVHLYGQLANLSEINKFAHDHNLVVIEDAAQSQGALFDGLSSANFGNSSATSFYPGKNLGALGDAGAVLTNDNVVAEKIRILRNYGSNEKYIHDIIGTNSRLDEIQAAFLRLKLKNLSRDNQRRIQIARTYSDLISNSAIVLPFCPKMSSPAWHLYVIRTKNRNSFMSYMRDLGIETLIHYPVPPHKQKCYLNEYLNYDLGLTEVLCEEIVSLPISPILSDSQVEYVVEAINKYNG